jgi:hypothetical protein
MARAQQGYFQDGQDAPFYHQRRYEVSEQNINNQHLIKL